MVLFWKISTRLLNVLPSINKVDYYYYYYYTRTGLTLSYPKLTTLFWHNRPDFPRFSSVRLSLGSNKICKNGSLHWCLSVCEIYQTGSGEQYTQLNSVPLVWGILSSSQYKYFMCIHKGLSGNHNHM